MGFFDDLLKTVGGETEKVVFGASAALSKVPYSGFGTPIGKRERAFREKYGGSLGQRKGTPSSSFTDGQDEQSAIMDLLTGTALPSLKAKLAQQGGQIAPEDLLTMQNIYRLRAGLASDQEQQAFLQSSVGSNFFQRFSSGELDDPETFAQAQDEWYTTVGPSLAQASAGMVLNEAGAPIDEDLAVFQAQQEQQAQMAQLSYQRDSLFNLLNMLPQQARFQVLPMLLEDPTYRRMLFGVEEEGGAAFGGGGIGTAIPEGNALQRAMSLDRQSRGLQP